LKKFDFAVTKGTDANTLIGVKADLADNYKIGFEHVLSDSSELKLGVTNKDLLDIQYVKVSPIHAFSWPNVNPLAIPWYHGDLRGSVFQVHNNWPAPRRQSWTRPRARHLDHPSKTFFLHMLARFS